jgi:CxxC motif-containing protein (DUF1111 family)
MQAVLIVNGISAVADVRAIGIVDPRRFRRQFRLSRLTPPRVVIVNAMAAFNNHICWHESSSAERTASKEVRGIRRYPARLPTKSRSETANTQGTSMKISVATFVAIGLVTAFAASVYSTQVQSQSSVAEPVSRFDNKTRRQRFTHQGGIDIERPGGGTAPAIGARAIPVPMTAPTEAPTGFDNLTNGFSEQGPAFESINADNVVSRHSFNDNRFIFEGVEQVADGLGPTYNAQSCRECHQNVVTGGASQVAEHRSGHLIDGQFENSLSGSIVQSRATYPELVEHMAVEDSVSTLRISTNILGDGFVEAISNQTLLAIRDRQPTAMRGLAVMVPVLEADSKTRIGRFGWKSQHASLESFASDAYLNEMGITSPLFPDENPAAGRDVQGVAPYDMVADPEDDGEDIGAFADFMRSTKAPPRGPITPDVTVGEVLFTTIGCAICHTASIITAPANTPINGGAYTVPAALGSKIIHPYSDYLLHDIGTGDGIPILPTAEYAATANQMRTAPLWALRTRNRLMHDGLSFTLQEAIQRHAGQATGVTKQYNGLSAAQQTQLIAFLNSL